VGFEAWTSYYPLHYESEHGPSMLVHNIFVQCVSELGYVGLFAFILLILGCVFVGSKIRKILSKEEDQFLYLMSYGFDLALVGFLVSGLFVTVLYYPYFWIHLAFVSAMYNIVRTKEIHTRSMS